MALPARVRQRGLPHPHHFGDSSSERKKITTDIDSNPGHECQSRAEKKQIRCRVEILN
jgi:hypothetical protein